MIIRLNSCEYYYFQRSYHSYHSNFSFFSRLLCFGHFSLELHVIDNGPGIPSALQDRLFLPLVSGREGGSGLGLHLAQTFVQQHHGLIEFESEPGHTDFKILIPLP